MLFLIADAALSVFICILKGLKFQSSPSFRTTWKKGLLCY